jgi:hypothetical protein
MKRTTLVILTMCISTIFLLNSSAMGDEQLSYGQLNYMTFKAGVYSLMVSMKDSMGKLHLGITSTEMSPLKLT